MPLASLGWGRVRGGRRWWRRSVKAGANFFPSVASVPLPSPHFLCPLIGRGDASLVRQLGVLRTWGGVSLVAVPLGLLGSGQLPAYRVSVSLFLEPYGGSLLADGDVGAQWSPGRSPSTCFDIRCQ